jgi:hypothetical protein
MEAEHAERAAARRAKGVVWSIFWAAFHFFITIPLVLGALFFFFFWDG